jgi:predicted flap endonuclease-1-like 5' DNA nuclease
MNLKENLANLDARVAAGDILGAYDTYFAENCTTFSNEKDRTHSKSQKREALIHFLNNVARVNNIELVGKPTIEGAVTTSRFLFNFTNRQGEKMFWDELIRRTWKDGLVVSEQYLAVQPVSQNAPKPTIRKVEISAPEASKDPVKSEKPTVKVVKQTMKADDLTLIEGIGPKIAELLRAASIVTFADLAVTKIEKLKTILDDAGARFKMHDPSTWPQQSALARDGKMADLKKLQDELKGGKIA